jgi:hypothetical protein
LGASFVSTDSGADGVSCSSLSFSSAKRTPKPPDI